MSVDPSGIRSNASQISNLSSEVRREVSNVTRDINSSTSYWSGLGAKSLQSQQGMMTNEMRTLIHRLEVLQSEMNRLSTEVQRAEAERAEQRRIAERLAVAEGTKKK